MAFNVGGLTLWVNDNSQTLITAAVLEAQTVPFITVVPGIKYKERLKYLETDLILQAGGCGWVASGTTTLNEKDLVVTSLRTMEELCPDDLEKYSLQLSMKAGKNTTIPFEQLYVQQKVKEIQKSIELMIWSSTNASSTKFAGFKYLMNNDADVIDNSFAWSATTWTASDYLTQIYAMQTLLPAEIQSMTDLTLFCGHEVFRKIVQALVIANLYHIDLSGNDGLSAFVFPGTNIKVQPVNGLNGMKYAVLTPASNLIFATDLMGEEDNIAVWYSQDNQQVRTVSNFKAGVEYYFGSYIVLSQ